MSAELLNIILPAVAALIGYFLRGRQPAPAPAPAPGPTPTPVPVPSDRPLLDLLLRLLRSLTPAQRLELEGMAPSAAMEKGPQEIFFRVEVAPPVVSVHNPK